VDLGPARALLPVTPARVLPHGLDLEMGGRRLVYSGDTGWFDDLPRHPRGADLLICDCTFHAPAFAEHMAYSDLIERAPSLGCERLVLTHLGASMSERRGQLELETADDGLTIEV
jgi:ribonuclease BN (tRNA processing enzyme)